MYFPALQQGQHPDHKGCSDLDLLGPVERWFATIMGLPRLKQRLQCVMAVRTFNETAALVSYYSTSLMPVQHAPACRESIRAFS